MSSSPLPKTWSSSAHTDMSMLQVWSPFPTSIAGFTLVPTYQSLHVASAPCSAKIHPSSPSPHLPRRTHCTELTQLPLPALRLLDRALFLTLTHPPCTPPLRGLRCSCFLPLLTVQKALVHQHLLDLRVPDMAAQKILDQTIHLMSLGGMPSML